MATLSHQKLLVLSEPMNCTLFDYGTFHQVPALSSISTEG